MKEISCQVELQINRVRQRFRPLDFLLCLLTIARSCFPIFGGQEKNVFKNFSRSNCRTSAGLFRSCFRSGRVLVATKESQPGDSSRDLFIPDRWRSRFHHLKGSLFHQPKRVTSRLARNVRSFMWGPRRTFEAKALSDLSRLLKPWDVSFSFRIGALNTAPLRKVQVTFVPNKDVF